MGASCLHVPMRPILRYQQLSAPQHFCKWIWWAKICQNLPRSFQPLAFNPQLCASPADIRSLPLPHRLLCPSPIPSDPQIKYSCLWRSHLALKLSSPKATVVISGPSACNQQEAGGRIGCEWLPTASVQPNAASTAMQSGSGLLQDADRRGQNPSAVRAGSLLLLHLLFLTLASSPASALAALEPLARPCRGTLPIPYELVI